MEFDTGNRPDPSGSGGSGGGTGMRPPGASAGGEFDYRDPVQSFVNVVRNLVTAPVGFFRGLAGHSDLINPLIFAVICYEIYTILNALFRLAGVGSELGFGGFLAAIILAPLFAAIGLFIGAGILHLLIMLIVGSGNRGFAATFRVSSYSSVSSLVSWIPIIGWIASLYGVYLAIVGVREVHNTTTGKAALVVLIPVITIFLLVVVFVILLGAALFFSAQQ